MVAEHKSNNLLLKKVAEIYNQLDIQIRNNSSSTDRCRACGECCDFESFDHRLFVTTPELIYLAENIGKEQIKPMTTSRCPYNANGKCTLYKYRFASCRIFCCKNETDFQNSLSESTLTLLKALCTEFQIPYHYTELSCALNDARLSD